MKPGDKVRVIGVPDSIKGLPDESQALFEACVGGVFKITDEREIAGVGKEFELLVSEVSMGDKYAAEFIWIESEFIKLV